MIPPTSFADAPRVLQDRRQDLFWMPRGYANGRHSLMRATMVSWTWPSLPSLRFCFELLLEARWRRPGLRRMSLPVPVTLMRFTAAFFVLRRAMDRGMGRAQ